MTQASGDPHVGLVLEGRGDVLSVPILLRAHCEKRGEFRDLLGKPVSCNGRDKALRPGGLEGFVAAAAYRPGCVGVLVVLDSEGDPVCEQGPALLTRAEAVTHVPIRICLADPKFEAWIVASAETLRIPGLIRAEGEPVGIIKSSLGEKYVKPVWQPKLTARIDPTLAATRSPSLARTLSYFDDLASLV